MNYYPKLPKYVFRAGLILLAIGFLKVICNLPMSEHPRQGLSGNSPAAMAAWTDSIGNAMAIRDGNERRSYNRGSAYEMIFFGVVGVFAGRGLKKTFNTPRENHAH